MDFIIKYVLYDIIYYYILCIIVLYVHTKLMSWISKDIQIQVDAVNTNFK